MYHDLVQEVCLKRLIATAVCLMAAARLAEPAPAARTYPRIDNTLGYKADPDWPKEKPPGGEWGGMSSVALGPDGNVWTFNRGKIPVQVFDRSGGATTNVRFNVYTDIPPNVAAELVVRAKREAANPPQQPFQQPHSYAPPYAAAAHIPQTYAPHAPALMGIPQAAPMQQAVPDLSSLVSQYDNSTLQQLLSSLQNQQQHSSAAVLGMAAAPAAAAAMPSYQPPPPVAGANPAIDINALLSNLRNAASGAANPASYANAAYANAVATPVTGQPAAPAPPAGLDPSIQSIMAQLAQYGGRQ